MDSNMPFPQRAANKSKKGRNSDIDEMISRILQQSKFKYTYLHCSMYFQCYLNWLAILKEKLPQKGNSISNQDEKSG